jgi:hypothetical protein
MTLIDFLFYVSSMIFATSMLYCSITRREPFTVIMSGIVVLGTIFITKM